MLERSRCSHNHKCKPDNKNVDPGERGSKAPELVSKDVNPSVSENVLQLFQDDDDDGYMNQGYELTVMNFEKLVNKMYYIDKTDFILKVLDLDEWVLAFFHHQNSESTMHLKALQCYCDFKEDRSTPNFKNLKVKINERYFGQFCVLVVSFDALNCDEQGSSRVSTILKEMMIHCVKKYLMEHSTRADEVESIINKLNKCDATYQILFQCMLSITPEIPKEGNFAICVCDFLVKR